MDIVNVRHLCRASSVVSPIGDIGEYACEYEYQHKYISVHNLSVFFAFVRYHDRLAPCVAAVNPYGSNSIVVRVRTHYMADIVVPFVHVRLRIPYSPVH